MIRLSVSLLSAVVLLISSSVTKAQQTTPPPRVVINFVQPVTVDSVNLLLAAVNNQIRANQKNITIVLSSAGGDTLAAFAAYNILRSLPVEITTFNAGSIDSASMLIYCAGKHRYSFASPTRFLIHANALTFQSVPLDAGSLESHLIQLKNLNDMVIDAISAVATSKRQEIETAIQNNRQIILSPDDAKQWGIVQEIRSTFMETGAVFVSIENQKSSVPEINRPLIITSESHLR